ncbi:hypothetical protein BBP40_008625 [Aspergillus hancockii]|nr:hypothetical protein BBP40_008625 [Aspergillus hancockii]
MDSVMEGVDCRKVASWEDISSMKKINRRSKRAINLVGHGNPINDHDDMSGMKEPRDDPEILVQIISTNVLNRSRSPDHNDRRSPRVQSRIDSLGEES